MRKYTPYHHHHYCFWLLVKLVDVKTPITSSLLANEKSTKEPSWAPMPSTSISWDARNAILFSETQINKADRHKSRAHTKELTHVKTLHWLTYLKICTLAQLHTCTFAILHVCILAHLHTYTFAYLHICILAHLRSCTFAHLHICLFAHWHTLLHTWKFCT